MTPTQRRNVRLVLIALIIPTVWLLFPSLRAAAATCDARVSAPADLQNRLTAAGRGKTVCLSGTFSTKTGEIRPLAGQTIIGGTLRYTGSYHVSFERRDVMHDGYDLGAGNVTLDSVTVLDFEGRGVVCGDHSTIRNSTLTGNKRNAIGCTGAGQDWWIRILNNTMTHNGSTSLERGTSGAVKLMEMSHPGHQLGAGGIMEGNIASDNIGNGLWWDRTSSAGIARNNVANNNTHSGIRCERCGGPFLIANNTTKANNWDGIGIRNTAKLTATGNVSTGNDRDINVSYGGADNLTYPAYRGGDGYHPYDVVIEDTRLAGKVIGCDISRVRCSA